MARLLFWLAIIFGVLFVLRLVNSKKTRRPDDQHAAPHSEPMVRCARCGVYLPRSEALESSGSYRCRDPRCHAS